MRRRTPLRPVVTAPTECLRCPDTSHGAVGLPQREQSLLIVGPVISLAPRHAKVRREGYPPMIRRVLSGCGKRPQGNAREIGESTDVHGDHRALSSQGRGGDQKVVCSTWSPGSSCMGKQGGVCTGRLQIVVLDRQRRKDRLDEARPSLAMGAIGQLDPDEELCHGDRCNRHVVFVTDDRVELSARPLDTHDDGGVEDQPFQGRSSTMRFSRRTCNSVVHEGSGLCFASKAFTARPRAVATGPRAATGRPPRVTTKDWWRCSIASRTSENCRATSVALISFISDQIIRSTCSAGTGQRPRRCLSSRHRSHLSRDIVHTSDEGVHSVDGAVGGHGRPGGRTQQE